MKESKTGHGGLVAGDEAHHFYSKTDECAGTKQKCILGPLMGCERDKTPIFYDFQ